MKPADQARLASAQIRETIAMLETVAYEVPSRKADVVKLVEGLKLMGEGTCELESELLADGWSVSNETMDKIRRESSGAGKPALGYTTVTNSPRHARRHLQLGREWNRTYREGTCWSLVRFSKARSGKNRSTRGSGSTCYSKPTQDRPE